VGPAELDDGTLLFRCVCLVRDGCRAACLSLRGFSMTGCMVCLSLSGFSMTNCRVCLSPGGISMAFDSGKCSTISRVHFVGLYVNKYIIIFRLCVSVSR
jgi:hypothetical protein